MTLRHKLNFALLLAIFMFTACSACRNQNQPANEDLQRELSSEPENYSATVVRLIEDGKHQEEITTRLVCAGDLRREEWVDASGKRALIFRPDLGKSFLLDLDNRLYIETDLTQPNVSTDKKNLSPPNHHQATESSESAAPSASSLQTVANDFLADSFEEEPTIVETRVLTDAKIGDSMCKVTEQSARFADGRVEITKTFRAPALKGLIVKSEMESVAPSQRLKIIVERRDIKLEVSADEFTVSAGFKKVERFPVVKPHLP